MNGPEDNTGKEAEAYGVVLKLLFLGLAAGFATLLIGWIVGSPYAILAFAVAVWVAAMKSIEKELIDKTAADRVYYSVAIFFVALFFIFNSPVRIKHGLQVRYNSIQQIVVDTGNTLAFLQSAAVKPEEFLAATRLAILDARQLVSGHCQSVLTPPLPRGEPTNPLGDPLDRCLANPLLVRSVDAQKLSTLIRSIDDVWMHRKDIHDLSTGKPEFSPIQIHLGNLSVAGNKLVVALYPNNENMPLKKAIEFAKSELERLQSELNEAGDSIKESVFEAERKQSYLAVFLDHVWPILLISLIGIRLGRRA